MNARIEPRLALDQGTKTRNAPFPPWPSYTSQQVNRAAEVLRSGAVNYWTGQECREFEMEFSTKFESRHAIALANGTVALELALEALDIGPDDEVVVTPRTFLASASSIVRRGAVPVFADVDPDSQNITARTIGKVLTSKTRAILPVHLAGWPCDMTGICALAKEHGLKVIEDCAQAIGAKTNGKYAGSFGHVGAHSFCQDKIVTTGGEGGMVVTDDENLWDRMWSLKDHGKKFSTVFPKDPVPAGQGFRWLHESFGTNGRLTEMQAAIGRAQLEVLSEWIETRRHHAARLTECFKGVPALRVTLPPRDVHHVYYKYYTFVRPERLRRGWDRERIMAAITAEGIPCYSGSCSEVYLEKAFEGTGFAPKHRLPVARELGETSLMFLVHPTLHDDDIEDTCAAVRKVFAVASRD